MGRSTCRRSAARDVAASVREDRDLAWTFAAGRGAGIADVVLGGRSIGRDASRTCCGFTSISGYLCQLHQLDGLRALRQGADGRRPGVGRALSPARRCTGSRARCPWSGGPRQRRTLLPVKSLDAVHLAQALHRCVEPEVPDMVFATHDRQQARVARCRFPVIGCTGVRRAGRSRDDLARRERLARARRAGRWRCDGGPRGGEEPDETTRRRRLAGGPAGGRAQLVAGRGAARRPRRAVPGAGRRGDRRRLRRRRRVRRPLDGLRAPRARPGPRHRARRGRHRRRRRQRRQRRLLLAVVDAALQPVRVAR